MNVHRNDFNRRDPYDVRAALRRGVKRAYQPNPYRHFVPVAVAAPAVVPTTPPPAWFRTRKIGGLRFFWCGRLVVSFCIKRKAQ